ncbi:hypothetical protein GLE_2845 [Lysobacter enzymogenes]|uniref:Uncharacterized protein n=1 Tax=Lysobacter enzymogenes TaxID=69 RepID=A0A0S2DIA8_LYSEN|nr:hypothetical protein [Lysobacter enzymogenes]ALN58193.1 hypothetical protein GLE_2845 [Lysobacter enzymogenes]
MPLPPACLSAQRCIDEFVRVGGDADLIAATLDGLLELDETQLGPAEAAAELAARHIADCPHCRPWRDARDPARAAWRARTARYCCAAMFEAVNEPRARPTFSFALFRNEDPCWRIDGQWSFARYCPWCGKPLPERAFEPGGAGD